jgi:hypothetical protein
MRFVCQVIIPIHFEAQPVCLIEKNFEDSLAQRKLRIDHPRLNLFAGLHQEE